MYYYHITIQFAKAAAPKFTDIHKLIENAVEIYNRKSLMAHNPKQIIEKKLRDDITLEVVLESTQELQESMAPKALRVLTSYLIDEKTENNLSGYITGKRLFKMIPKRMNVANTKDGSVVKASKADDTEITVDDFEQLATDEKLNRIYRKLVDFERRYYNE
jgi:hypothetical protein